jgi:hypothetical protein
MRQAYLATLAEIHNNKRFDDSATQWIMLFHRYALEYNGDRWVDVHPLIYDLPEFQRELKRLASGKKTRKRKLKDEAKETGRN